MLGSIISGIGSVIGGIFGQNSQEDQIQAQIDAQKQFAQNGIQWRVEDATKAGIHPLYALGANTTSFSPIGVGGNPLGEGIAAASQDIGRAISSKATSVERAYNAKIMQLQLQRGELENAILASQLARQNNPTQMPPALPQTAGNRWLLEGQGSTVPGEPLPERFGGPLPSTLVTNAPLERTVSDPSNPHSEPGAVTDVGWARTANGGYAPIPSSDVKQRIEDNWIAETAWAMRNMMGPNISGNWQMPPFAPPPGKHWQWSWADQAYYLENNPNNKP